MWRLLDLDKLIPPRAHGGVLAPDDGIDRDHGDEEKSAEASDATGTNLIALISRGELLHVAPAAVAHIPNLLDLAVGTLASSDWQ